METKRVPISADDERILTLVGLLFESATGAQEVLHESFPPASQLTAQLFGPLLRVSRSEGGRMRMSDLAAQCRSTPSAMTRVADRLEKLGYAQRESLELVEFGVVEVGEDRRSSDLEVRRNGPGDGVAASVGDDEVHDPAIAR
ncbi:MAG: MarR family transcriptional regulator, partial [Actinobacteria bacterium]|nr:MarR family transcriptional regulator [Actinomycetota bacterium]